MTDYLSARVIAGGARGAARGFAKASTERCKGGRAIRTVLLSTRTGACWRTFLGVRTGNEVRTNPAGVIAALIVRPVRDD